MDKFTNVLSKFWGSYNLDMWTQSKVWKSDSLETKLLWLPHFLENFNSNEYVDSIITGLSLWVDLCKFTHITIIDDNDVYKNEMGSFESKLNVLFTA